MAATTSNSAYREGIRAGLPFLVVVAPFGMLFGVVATDAGLPLVQAMVMSIAVIAGASQFAALQLMLDGSGLWLALAGALAVNLRMAMYSAALVPHLGAAPLWQRAILAFLNFDQTYAVAVARYEAEPGMSVRDKVHFFFGVATPIAPLWGIMTLVGILAGSTIPPELALDFALPITFLAVVAPMLKSAAHIVAAVVSVAVGLGLSGLPAGTGLLIAAACACAAGALVESWRDRRAVPGTEERA